jgi:hypothetical protein
MESSWNRRGTKIRLTRSDWAIGAQMTSCPRTTPPSTPHIISYCGSAQVHRQNDGVPSIDVGVPGPKILSGLR